MPSKPIEQGFKFHCLADHGYIWDFLPTSNQAGPDPVPSIEGITPTGEIVYHLLGQLPQPMYWVAYLDNFYTTIPLLGRLRHDYRIGGCGTARPSSAGFPADLKIPKQNIAKFEYHSSKARVVTDPIFNQQVGVLLWFDNAPVTIMTTVHRLDAEVLRNRKRPGKKSTNAKRAREAFGEDQQKEMPIPVCFDEYNHHMGGVDITDQLRSYYDTQLTSFRTWWPMMFWGLDTMATNAYLIYSDIEDLPPISHKEFRLQCAWGLILAGPSLETRSRDAAPKPAKKVNIKSDTALPLDRSGPGHMPIHLPPGKKLACCLCRWKRRGDGKESKDVCMYQKPSGTFFDTSLVSCNPATAPFRQARSAASFHRLLAKELMVTKVLRKLRVRRMYVKKTS